MALRTFQSNPALGGFGGESTVGDAARNGDAFAQIVKELVDNAVDACHMAMATRTDNSRQGNQRQRRVRVLMERLEPPPAPPRQESRSSSNDNNRRKSRRNRSNDDEEYVQEEEEPSDGDDEEEDERCSSQQPQEILRITVSDNGCGMESIEQAVQSFHTSKAHNAANARNKTTRDNSNRAATAATATASSPAQGSDSSYEDANGDDAPPPPAGNRSESTISNNKEGEEPSDGGDPATASANQTAGRYGMGLTLCLLHAQRLVPGSCASITSATAQQTHWSTRTCVVDAHQDSIHCLVRRRTNANGQPQRPPAKSFPTESGTAVSVLVPGGTAARMAWPRLAEYFVRFKLSRGLSCTVEVRAPCLSPVPLYVRPATTALEEQPDGHQEAIARRRSSTPAMVEEKKEGDERPWMEGLDYEVDGGRSESPETENVNRHYRSTTAASVADPDDHEEEEDLTHNERTRIWKAVQLYLERPLELRNVTHAMVPIRRRFAQDGSGGVSTRSRSRAEETSGASERTADYPQLEVDLIIDNSIINSSSDEEEEDTEVVPRSQLDPEVSVGNLHSSSLPYSSSEGSTMALIRMVNRIPLMDGAEAVACGLVQGMASKKQLWNSLGLDVSLCHDPRDPLKIPTFEVKDSEQVAPFFQNRNHALFQEEEEHDSEDLDDENDNDELNSTQGGSQDMPIGAKRKRKNERRHTLLLPAKARLGNVFVIVQIHADPTVLPLPTLSKGRLPVDDVNIDTALEVGLEQCLRQLQKSNPGLLLTATQLRKAERDARYVPAVSSAVASILSRSVSLDKASVLSRIQNWAPNSSGGNIISPEPATEETENKEGNESPGNRSRPNQQQIEELGALIEGRLRLALSHGGKPKKIEKADDDDCNNEQEEEEREFFGDIDESERTETQAEEPPAAPHPDEDDYDDDWL